MARAATLPPLSPMRTVRSSLPDREVTAKAEGCGCGPETAPAEVAAPFPPIRRPATRADVADFLVDQLRDRRFSRAMPVVSG